MFQRKTSLLVIGLTLTLLFLPGFICNKAMQSSVGVAASLKAFQDGEIAMHNIGKISDDEHTTLQKSFIMLAETDKQVRQCIYTSGSGDCVDIAVTAVNQVLSSPTVVGIKNPDSKQQIQLLGQSLITALNTLKAAL